MAKPARSICTATVYRGPCRQTLPTITGRRRGWPRRPSSWSVTSGGIWQRSSATSSKPAPSRIPTACATRNSARRSGSAAARWCRSTRPGLGSRLSTKDSSIASELTIGYHGGPCAYSEEALHATFPTAKPQAFRTLRHAFHRVADQSAAFALVPAETSQGGSVLETYDLLLGYSALISAGVRLQLHHRWLALPAP